MYAKRDILEWEQGGSSFKSGFVSFTQIHL
jgi:hypothetical protein